MEIIGGLILFGLIVAGGVWVSERVSRGARQRIPAHARQRVAGGARAAGQSVRAIRAKPWADARAANWLERKRAARERKASRPARSPRAAPAARRGLAVIGKGTGAGGRAIGRAIGTVVRPNTTQHVPGVTDQPKRPRLQPVPVPVTAQPVPVSDPAPKTSPQQEGKPAMAPTRNTIPPDFAALVARIAQFEPETDGDLIAFLRGVAAGTAAIGEALEQHADHLSNGVGLDPAATAAITESAQAYTEAAQAVSRADARFQAVYAGVRETAAGGTVLPFRGRWITGESA